MSAFFFFFPRELFLSTSKNAMYIYSAIKIIFLNGLDHILTEEDNHLCGVTWPLSKVLILSLFSPLCLSAEHCSDAKIQ